MRDIEKVITKIIRKYVVELHYMEESELGCDKKDIKPMVKEIIKELTKEV